MSDADFDRQFQAWKAKNPDGRFSDYFNAVHVPKIAAGGAHATLGTNLKNQDWQSFGHAPFELLKAVYCEVSGQDALPRETILCDYGCGTLRVGGHIMPYLDPGHYIGLDISQDLVDLGADTWSEVVQARTPLLGTLDAGLEAAVEKAPDIVFAVNVVCHIHPEESDRFYANIKALLHKPGAMALLHVLTYDRPIRYKESGWAHPMPYYDAQLAPLQRVSHSRETLATWTVGAYEMLSCFVAFRRG